MYPTSHNSIGAPWQVYWSSAIHGAGTLVSPTAIRRDNVVGIDNTRFVIGHQIIVLGVSYAVDTAGTSETGVRLTAVTPGGATRTIWQMAAQDNAALHGGFSCFWPLSPAQIGSPLEEAASLAVELVGTPTLAHLTIHGIQVSGNSGLGGTELWVSPPFQFGA